MSKWSNFWTQIHQGIAKFFRSNPVSSFINKQTGAGLTGAEIEQNAINIQEAEKQRDWTEQMRSTNFQTQVQDMQAAGLNPALMYQSGGSASTPSGASAAAASPNPTATLSDLMQLMMLKKDMKLKDAQAESIQAGTEKTRQETEKLTFDTELAKLTAAAFPNVNAAQLAEIYSRIDLNATQEELNNANRDLARMQELLTEKNKDNADKLANSLIALQSAQAGSADAQAALANAEAAWQGLRSSYYNSYHTDIPAGGWASLLSYLDSKGVSLDDPPGTYKAQVQQWINERVNQRNAGYGGDSSPKGGSPSSHGGGTRGEDAPNISRGRDKFGNYIVRKSVERGHRVRARGRVTHSRTPGGTR